jgi:hypothetical protein
MWLRRAFSSNGSLVRAVQAVELRCAGMFPGWAGGTRQIGGGLHYPLKTRRAVCWFASRQEAPESSRVESSRDERRDKTRAREIEREKMEQNDDCFGAASGERMETRRDKTSDGGMQLSFSRTENMMEEKKSWGLEKKRAREWDGMGNLGGMREAREDRQTVWWWLIQREKVRPLNGLQ